MIKESATELVGFCIAIDGPTGAGKTTIGRYLARMTQGTCIDTGLMYRAVAFLGLRSGVADLKGRLDSNALSRIASELDLSFRDDSTSNLGPQRIFVHDEDITAEVRGTDVDQIVSIVASVPSVREALTDLQRLLAGKSKRVVMLGRDIGSVVLPDADLKLYLDADPAIRAERRMIDLERQGASESALVHAKANLLRRDKVDSNRVIAPMRVATDALIIRTDEKSIAQTLALILGELLIRLPSLRGTIPDPAGINDRDFR